MNESNEITVGDIISIVYIKNKDLAKRSDFSGKLEHHELIFRISGSCEVEFDDQKFIEKENYIRFLPCGAGEKYRTVRLDEGDCVDIFFDSDKPLSDKAFCRLSSHERCFCVPKTRGAKREAAIVTSRLPVFTKFCRL